MNISIRYYVKTNKHKYFETILTHKSLSYVQTGDQSKSPCIQRIHYYYYSFAALHRRIRTVISGTRTVNTSSVRRKFTYYTLLPVPVERRNRRSSVCSGVKFTRFPRQLNYFGLAPFSEQWRRSVTFVLCAPETGKRHLLAKRQPHDERFDRILFASIALSVSCENTSFSRRRIVSVTHTLHTRTGRSRSGFRHGKSEFAAEPWNPRQLPYAQEHGLFCERSVRIECPRWHEKFVLVRFRNEREMTTTKRPSENEWRWTRNVPKTYVSQVSTSNDPNV